MNPGRRLPFTPRPQAGESPLSVIRRGAIGNGHKSALRFAFALNPGLDHSVTGLGTLARSPVLFRETCRAMGLSDDESELVAYRRAGLAREDDLLWNGLAVSVGDLQFRRAKLCIACYLEDGFAHSEWDHFAAVACSRHRVLLDDACPCCSTPWTHVRDPLRCGCDATEMVRRQQPCRAEPADLMRRLIGVGNQAGIRLLGAAWSVLQWWKTLGLNINQSLAADALADLHAGRWPSIGRIVSGDHRVHLHPRVALAPMLADGSPVHAEHAEMMLAVPAPQVLVSTLTSETWPASTAMAVLGIGRVPYDKLVYAGHIPSDDHGDVQVATINDLLWTVAPINHGPIVTEDRSRLRSGRSRQSLASIVGTIKAEAVMESGIKGLEDQPLASRNSGMNAPVITLAIAAAKLRTNTESVRGAIRVGLIAAHKGTADNAVAWCIDPVSLERFDCDYVFASAIAADYQAARTTLASRLRSAGLPPVSGPGLDDGVTYVFRRGDLVAADLERILREPYRSPAGRKNLADRLRMSTTLSRTDAATLLALSGRDLNSVVADGWLAPVSGTPSRWRFDREGVDALAEQLRSDYRDVRNAIDVTGQTSSEFRRTWIDTGFVHTQRFGGRELIAVPDLERIAELWRASATGTAIGRSLNRARWLCPNLQKMNKLQPVVVLGSGTRRVRLYPRNAEPLGRYDRR